MEQGLQGASFAFLRRPFREQPRDEMMLIGKAAQRQATFLRALDDAGPVHMRCDVRAANAL